ncbi:MAG: alkaline phosphatase family protein [Christensenellales bacterium]|jgi:predicted AlkP superfamily pyrophosphatase or phosphodiesterase
MPKKRLIIISQDALVFEDLTQLKEMPNFKLLMERGSQVETLRTIYPTVTYPAHASMITGTYPNKHGVINNEKLVIGELSSDWHWFRDANKAETLFDAAKKAGLTTAGVFWPVTGNDPSIDYLIAEYWSQGKGDTPREAFRRAGTSEELLTSVVDKHLPQLVERTHPEADIFIMRCACDIIEKYRPHLLCIHPAHVDDFRHKTGLFNDKVSQGLTLADEWMGWIIEATKRAGIFEETNFVVMSDHGQIDIKRTIHPNVILRDHGLITVNDEEELTDWQAYSKSAALSAHIYLKNPEDRAIHDKTYDLLRHMCDEGIYGISQVFTRDEINKLERLDGGFSFVIETDGFTAFGNDWRRPLVRSYDLSDYRFGRATHGHLPDKGPQPTLVAMGPDFAQGATVRRRPIVDCAPTFAKVLGIELPNADGSCIAEILSGK